MFHLANLNFMDVDRLSKSGRTVIVVPIGSVEEHGPHLPLGLDTFAAEVYAEEIAPHLEQQGFEVILAPSIYYGSSSTSSGFSGHIDRQIEYPYVVAHRCRFSAFKSWVQTFGDAQRT